MDTLVHGVIGAAICSRTGLAGGRRGPVDANGVPRKTDWTLWAAFLFGIFPDVASLGIHFLADFCGRGVRWHAIPPFVFTLYNITHSLTGMVVGYFCSLHGNGRSGCPPSRGRFTFSWTSPPTARASS